MHLELTEKFAREGDPKSIHSGLNKYLPVRKPKLLIRKSVDPVSTIKLLGDAAEWLLLSVPATVYLSTLAKHAADATWSKLAAVKQSTDVRPLTDVAATLTMAAKSVEGETKIVIGINIPDNKNGTELHIQSIRPEDMEYNLASFIYHVENLSIIMQGEMEAGRITHGPAFIELRDDGTLSVKWRCQAKDYNQIIPKTRETE